MNIQLIVNGPDSKRLHDTVVITPDIARQIYIQGYLEVERERKAAGDLSPAGKAFLAQLDEQAQPAQPSDSCICGPALDTDNLSTPGFPVHAPAIRTAQPSGDDAREALKNLEVERGNSDDDGTHLEPLDLADWQINGILAAIRANPGLYVPEIAALRERLAEAEAWDKHAADAMRRARVAEDKLSSRERIIEAALRELPVGNMHTHTADSIPGRIAHYVAESGRLDRMEAERDRLAAQVEALKTERNRRRAPKRPGTAIRCWPTIRRRWKGW